MSACDFVVVETGESHGLPWVIIQLRDDDGPRHMCGYVGVPSSHPWHSCDYGQATPGAVREAAEAACWDEAMYAIQHATDYDLTPAGRAEVHGGLTWADRHPSCGEDERASWWFGFDAAHAGDLSSPNEHPRPEFGANWYATYKDAAYMRRECESLARQLSEVTA